MDEMYQPLPPPTEYQRWQAAQERAHTAAERVPVAMTKDVHPMVVCRDGSVWQLFPGTCTDPENPEVRAPEQWRQLPPIPGSHADLAHTYWKEPT